MVADSLSRPPRGAAQVAAAEALLDYRAMAAAQEGCQDTRAAHSSSLTLHKVSFDGVELLCDTGGPQPRPLVPAVHRRAVFAAFHNMAHPGVKATGRLLGARLVWPGMKSDVQRWVADC